MQQTALGLGAVGTGLIIPGSLSGASLITGKSRNPHKVLVLGAGPSGLATAWELKDAGQDVTVLGVEKVYPGAQNHFQKGYIKAWSEDPYAMGGPSWPAPGDVTRYLVPLQQSHDNIHFTWEHTSILCSTIEGALRSGTCAAKAVHESG